MQFENTLVDERFILSAIHGARLSYGNNSNSDSFMVGTEIWIGDEDTRFLQARLSAEVQGENKFLRVIPVSVVITAPLKLFVELDTYKIATTRQSSSLMHRVASKGLFSPDDFDVQDKNDPGFLRILETINEKYKIWLDSGGRRNDKYSEWRDWQDLIPRSYLYTSQWYGSYATLRNIWFQRRNHRMADHWTQFQGWIETLPHSWLITFERQKHAKT